MEYDLTTFLVAIISATASLVAILGGLIASKLLNINNERQLVKEQLLEITSDIQQVTNELGKLNDFKNTEDSLCFINNNIQNIIYGEKLEDVYKNSENYDISMETLLLYWNRAINISNECLKNVDNFNECNSDDIPNFMAEKYKDSEFDYEALRLICGYVKRELRKDSSSNLMFCNLYTPPIDNSYLYHNLSYTKKIEEISKLDYELKCLEGKKKFLLQKEKSLIFPKGVSAGMYIFIIFAVACIVIPLFLLQMQTNDKNYFVMIKTIFSFTFCIGVVSIFTYLIYLYYNGNNRR